MPRLSKVDPASAPPEVKPIFDAMLRQRGNVPNMYRTMAHRPEILTTMAAHFKAVMAPTTLSSRLKELVVLRVSAINGCDY
ncbi:MAG: carboxymuconolactone decarboxylase family protein [Planctomycetes bacterium]|nr:carboxymuconolactone decarboxylase family protein [Planctomycetota bacterium]